MTDQLDEGRRITDAELFKGLAEEVSVRPGKAEDVLRGTHWIVHALRGKTENEIAEVLSSLAAELEDRDIQAEAKRFENRISGASSTSFALEHTYGAMLDILGDPRESDAHLGLFQNMLAISNQLRGLNIGMAQRDDENRIKAAVEKSIRVSPVLLDDQIFDIAYALSKDMQAAIAKNEAAD